jgi:hypothetical protein
MHRSQSITVAACVAALIAARLPIANAQAPINSPQLPFEPAKERGDSVTGAFEGWYKNSDGTFTLLMGYQNRNTKETLEIPVGPNNRIDPGGPDHGQPTVFEPRRGWGIFTITVPKDFGNRKFTWTITANGETTAIPLGLNAPYEISPFKDPQMGNTPPILKFAPQGAVVTGPPRGMAASYTAVVGQPVTIELWAADKGNTEGAAARAGLTGIGVTITLHKFRGPGDVRFENARPPVGREDGKVSAAASFSTPGEYIVRVQANDSSGEGGIGFQCCWTNAHVKVRVK